ncbi:MAG: sulfite oxidase heme-binding subunit YedZ [Granulosicoccus sp.]
MKSFLNSHYLFWLLLALPSIPMTMAIISGGGAEHLLHPTGEFAARFMIIAMIISPFRLIFPKNRFWFLMMRRRRYLGVAAFGYALAHTILYVVDMASFANVLSEALLLGIWTGWLAMFIFIPLAITSNDWSVKRLGHNWKRLQQMVYLAAIATLLHWIFVHNNIGPALVHFVPLAGLELYRIWKINQTQVTAEVAS